MPRGARCSVADWQTRPHPGRAWLARGRQRPTQESLDRTAGRSRGSGWRGQEPGATPAATVPRPSSRARARALEAAAISASLLAPSAGKRATPAETVIGRPATAGRARMPVEDALGDRHAGRSGRHEHELVAADPPDRVDEPDRLGQDRGDTAEDVVAGLVTAAPVGRLEVVDVEHRERDLAALAAARASSSSRMRATVRSLARPVSGSVCAIRSNQSERSASGRRQPRRDPRRPTRATRTPGAARARPRRARAATASRGPSSRRPPGRHRWTRSAAGRHRRTAIPSAIVASRSKVALRPSAASANGCVGIGHVLGQARRRVVVEAVGRHRLQPGPIGVLDEDRAHRSTRGPRLPRRARRRARLSRSPALATPSMAAMSETPGIAGRSVGRHGRLLHATRWLGARIVHLAIGRRTDPRH